MRGRVRAAIQPTSTGFELALLLRGVTALVSLVHLPVSLAGPAPSGSTGASRRCRGCCPPSPSSPGSGCPQLHRPAATKRRWWSFTSIQLMAPRGARVVGHGVDLRSLSALSESSSKSSCSFAWTVTTKRALASSCSSRAFSWSVSYTHLRAHETVLDLVCRLLL